MNDHKGARMDRTPQAATIKRLRAAWLEGTPSLSQLVRSTGISRARVEAICADLPVRKKAAKLKRQAPNVPGDL